MISETLDGAELSRLLLGRGTRANDIAVMDLEPLTRLVAYRRKSMVDPGAIDPEMTDEQIARAILDYLQVDVTRPTLTPRAPLRTWLWPLAGTIVGATVGFVTPWAGTIWTDPNAHLEYLWIVMITFCAFPGAVVGLAAGLVAVWLGDRARQRA